MTAAIRITREKVYWLMPSIDMNLPSHVDTQVLLLKFPTSRVHEERIACVLPLTTDQYMGTLRGRGSNIEAHFESDLTTKDEQVKDGKVIIAIAPQIKDALRLAIDGARRVLRISPISDLGPERHIFSDTLT
jgi:hypothetical protein